MNKKEQNINKEKISERLAYVVGEVGGDIVWMLRCLPKVAKQELVEKKVVFRIRPKI